MYVKGVPFFNRRHAKGKGMRKGKGCVLCERERDAFCAIKGNGLDLGAEPPHICCVPRPPG